MRRIFEKFDLFQDLLAHLLRQFNKLNLYDKFCSAASQARDEFQMKHRHRIVEWNAQGLVLDIWRTGPDTEEGRAFLDAVDSDSLHEIATGLNWLDRRALRWLHAFATHPKCDKSTGWSLFLLADAEHYEGVIREAGFRPEFRLADASKVSLLDVLHARLVAHDFATSALRPDDVAGIGKHRSLQLAAEQDGHNLHWELPDYAYSVPTGRKPRPKFELWEAEKIMVPFQQWIRANPEKRKSMETPPSLPETHP